MSLLYAYRFELVEPHRKGPQKVAHPDSYEINLGLSGVSHVRVEREVGPRGPGQTELIPPSWIHSSETRAHGMSGHNLHLRASALEELTRGSGLRLDALSARPFTATAELRHAFASLRREREREAAPGGALMTEALATQIALWVLRRSGARRRTVAEARDVEFRLARARELLHASVAAGPSLEELARVAELSPYHFLRAFRRAYGLTPHAYLLQLRLDRAQELMRDPKLSLTAIAHAVGFASSSRFTEAFQRRHGIAPSRWRKGR